MKKLTLHGVALATMTVFALVSCQKEKTTISEFTATVERCTDGNGKVMLDGNVLRWTDGDQIAVWGSDGMGTYTTSNVGEYVTTFNFTEGDDPGDPTYTAIYPASLAQRQAVILLPPVQTSTDGSLQQFPMMARSSNSELEFKNLCGTLRLRLQATSKSVVGIELAGGPYLWGMYQLNYNNGEPTLQYIGNGSSEVMLSITNPLDITTAKDFYIAMPPNTYGAGFTIKIYTSDGSVCTKTITSGHSFRIERSGIFTITLSGDDLEFIPDAGALNGEFSVSPTKKVRFSQGNLMYTGFGSHAMADGGMAEGTWRFNFKQTGYTNLSGMEYSSKWIGRFSWGTSGWNSGANNYLPHTINGHSSDYYPGGNSENNLEGPYAYADWGVYNAILNGGNQPQQWRILSYDEWDYLFNQRRGHAVKWGIASISGSGTGVVLLPDRWILPEGIEFNEGPTIGGTVMNSYSAQQWKQMEDAGAVILCGYGNPSYYFWSSSVYGLEGAGSLYIASNHSEVRVSGCQRWSAQFVRLVKDVN